MKAQRRRFRQIAWMLTISLLSNWTLSAQDITFLRIGTGSTAGTYYTVGSLIGSAISNPPGSRGCEEGGSCGVAGVVAAAQSTSGSVANIKALVAGELDMALVQADVAFWAANAKGPFRGQAKATNIRAIARLYPEAVQVVARRAAKIDNIASLKGRRVSLDTAGSGTRQTGLLVLQAYGLNERQFKSLALDPDGNVDATLKGRLDAFFFVGGYPAFVVQDLAHSGEIELLPITGPYAAKLIKSHPFFSPITLPAGTYNGVGETPTLAVNALLLTNANMSDALVAQITSALWHEKQRPIYDKGPAITKEMQLSKALEGIPIPLHKGAETYYQQINLIKPDVLILK